MPDSNARLVPGMPIDAPFQLLLSGDSLLYYANFGRNMPFAWLHPGYIYEHSQAVAWHDSCSDCSYNRRILGVIRLRQAFSDAHTRPNLLFDHPPGV